MTAKEYLSQIKTINIRLNVMSRQLQSLQDALTNINPAYSDMPKSATHGIRRLEELIIAKVDLENEMTAEGLKLAEIQKTIRSLSDPYLQAIVTARYVDGDSWDIIAKGLFVSEARIYQLHRTALHELEKTIANYS